MHLSSEMALDLIEGRLPDDQKTFWHRHLDLCMDCTAEIGHWREVEIGLKRSHLKSASGESLRNAIEIASRQRSDSGSTSRSVVATILFDSFLEPALAGARGASTARQLVMRAETFDIHIKIWGERESRQILGQVLPRSGGNFAEFANLHLLREGQRLESAAADNKGEFHFTDVPEGDLSIQIDLPNVTVIGALNFRGM